jgi:hypothetical protein
METNITSQNIDDEFSDDSIVEVLVCRDFIIYWEKSDKNGADECCKYLWRDDKRDSTLISSTLLGKVWYDQQSKTWHAQYKYFKSSYVYDLREAAEKWVERSAGVPADKQEQEENTEQQENTEQEERKVHIVDDGCFATHRVVVYECPDFRVCWEKVNKELSQTWCSYLLREDRIRSTQGDGTAISRLGGVRYDQNSKKWVAVYDVREISFDTRSDAEKWAEKTAGKCAYKTEQPEPEKYDVATPTEPDTLISDKPQEIKVEAEQVKDDDNWCYWDEYILIENATGRIVGNIQSYVGYVPPRQYWEGRCNAAEAEFLDEAKARRWVKNEATKQRNVK